MNKEALRGVKSFIQAHPDWLDMQTYRTVKPECGTVHCIAGFAVMIYRPQTYAIVAAGQASPFFSWADTAAEIFGIDYTVSMELFDPWPCFVPHDCPEPITPEMACRAIDNVIKYGSPCWLNAAWPDEYSPPGQATA